MTTKRTGNGNGNDNGNRKDNPDAYRLGECLELVEGFGVFVEDHVG